MGGSRTQKSSRILGLSQVIFATGRARPPRAGSPIDPATCEFRQQIQDVCLVNVLHVRDIVSRNRKWVPRRRFPGAPRCFYGPRPYETFLNAERRTDLDFGYGGLAAQC